MTPYQYRITYCSEGAARGCGLPQGWYVVAQAEESDKFQPIGEAHETATEAAYALIVWLEE